MCKKERFNCFKIGGEKMKVALVGNQNAGKSTLFNILTNDNQKTGNWSGVTVDSHLKKIDNLPIQMIDLPGVYSLSAYTKEEEYTRNFLMNEDVDIIINVIDANLLSRSLYLTSQILEMDKRVIIALNFNEEAEKNGKFINGECLGKFLGVKVIKINPRKNIGINELIKCIYLKEKKNHFDIMKGVGNELLTAITKTNSIFIKNKLLEQDEFFRRFVLDENKLNINLKTYADIEKITNERHKFASDTADKVTSKIKANKNYSQIIDNILLSKYFSIPIFLVVMCLVFFLSVGIVGNATYDYVYKAFIYLKFLVKNLLISLNLKDWIISLVVDGIITGVGAVVCFIPQLIILFICINILEQTGYMARVSFLLDRLFDFLNLNGKSLIPFIVGLGCGVPAILSTRTIENKRQRELTIMLTPFVPCSAKLPIITLFSGYFFAGNAWVVTCLIYLLSIIIIVLSAFIFKHIFKKKEREYFMFDVPSLKMPSFNYMLKCTYDKTIEFITRAGSIILICSVILWFLLSFDFSLHYGVNVDNSILAFIGKKISFIFVPILGEQSWTATVSILQGLITKEQVISSMSVISGISGISSNQIFSSSAFSFFNSSSAMAFLIFNLFSFPCMGSISAMKKELGSNKKLFLVMFYQITFSYLIAFLVFQFGCLF